MRSKNLLIAAMVSVCLVVNGCASFSASQLPQRSINSFPNKITQGDLVVAAENFYSRGKSNTYFDTDLTKRYVAPVFFVVSNTGGKEYAVDTASFSLKASNIKEELRPMNSAEVAKKIKRGVFWRTFGWCMIVPIIAIPVALVGSGVQTSNVNKNAKADINNKSLAEGVVLPNDTLRGVVFFDVARDRVRALVKPVINAVFISPDNQKVEFEIEL